jgi:hypothetical protein
MPSRAEPGRWVGRVSLRGEDGYFTVSTRAAPGELDRTFLLRCRFKHAPALPAPESLSERVAPRIGASLVSILLGTISSVEAESKEGGRLIGMRAAHADGGGPGAEVEAGAFEHQGRMPVGRFVQVLDAPAGSLTTTLPGEHPATAALKPGRPFRGEATYLAASPTDHRWTGDLKVRFPGLVVPLAGPAFYSTLCVVSPLVKPRGCEFELPSWQGDEALVEAPR